MKQSNNQTVEDSKLHWLFLPDANRPAEPYNTVLTETRNFAVLPTKGSIVPGWVLVVPKFPISRMADIPQSMYGELEDLVGSTVENLQSRFGNAYTFEHGGFSGSKVSCGVDQAHLHVTSLDFDLLDAAQLEIDKRWFEASPCRIPLNIPTREEYWFASSSDRSIFVPVDLPRSQLFRRLIAKGAGQPARWDYRIDDFGENVELTIKALAGNE